MKYAKIATFIIVSLLLSSHTYSQKMRKGTLFLGTNSLGFISKVNSTVNNTTIITANNQSTTNSIDYTINSDDEYNLNVNLKGGYLIMDNFLFGLDANINTTDILKNYTNPSDTNFLYSLDSDESIIMLGCFIRYYYHLGEGFLFASSGFNYGMLSSNSTEIFINESKTNILYNDFGLGYSFKIKNRFSLEPEFVYYIQDKTTEMSSEGGLLNTLEEITITESTQGVKFKLGISFYL